MIKRIICIFMFALVLFSAFGLFGCKSGRSFGEKPEGFDDPMPEIWEEVLSGKLFDETVIDETAASITIGADITDINTYKIHIFENLENIYVEEGNEVFASDDGVLYSKSFETLYKWPVKKPVTEVRDTVKYFAPFCFFRCEMPEDFEIPDQTITIGLWAFHDSTLTKIHMKENVQSVGASSYSDSTKVYGICNVLSKHTKAVEISAPIVYPTFFANAVTTLYYEGIETIIFNEGVRQIRSSTKSINQSSLKLGWIVAKNIEFPSTLEAIGDIYFPVNMNIEKYIIPESVVYLGDKAFDDYQIKRSFLEYFSCASSPWIIDRNVTTEFECQNQLSKDYIEYKKPTWEETVITGT